MKRRIGWVLVVFVLVVPLALVAIDASDRSGAQGVASPAPGASQTYPGAVAGLDTEERSFSGVQVLIITALALSCGYFCGLWIADHEVDER